MGIVDDAGCWRLEPDERLEVGQAPALEVHVVDQPHGREQEYRERKERPDEDCDTATALGPKTRSQAPYRPEAP